jgi:subtilase family serine protease
MTFFRTAFAAAMALAIGSLGAQTLLNHVPQAVSASKQLGPVAATSTLNLAIGLHLRNREELDVLVEQIADPLSANYRHYLSSSEFAERFGPTQEDYDKLIAFVRENGPAVSGTHANRMILDVTGPVGAINKALHISLTMWDHSTRGRFFAPDRNPSMDVDVEVLDISGLDNFLVPKPMDLKLMPMTAPFRS